MEVQKNQWKAWIYLAPTLVLLIIFTIYPLINTFLISFYEDYIYASGARSGIGLGNYRAVFQDAAVLSYFKNTLIIVFVSVPLSMMLAIGIAVALNSIKKLTRVYQTIFFLPYVTNTIAIGMTFSVLFMGKGLINSVINLFGSESINWLGDLNVKRFGNPTYAGSMLVLMLFIIWNSIPFKILILLSGLQGIDKQYYQAAQIDGASKMRTLLRITVPLLSPQIAYLTVTSFIGAFKEYTSVVSIFGEKLMGPPTGRPGTKMLGTVVYYIYNNISNDFMGYSAAAAVLLFIIILIFTALNLYISKKRVHY